MRLIASSTSFIIGLDITASQTKAIQHERCRKSVRVEHFTDGVIQTERQLHRSDIHLPFTQQIGGGARAKIAPHSGHF